GCVHLVWRAPSHGRSAGANRHHQAICGSNGKFYYRLEVVAGFGVAAADLFLRALRLRQHHSPRDGDGCSVSDRDSGCGNADISGSSFARLLLKPRRSSDALRHYTGTDLLRRRLHNATNLVDGGSHHVVDNDLRLDHSGLYLVESAQTLVI